MQAKQPEIKAAAPNAVPQKRKELSVQQRAQATMKSMVKAALPQFTNALPAAIKPERFQSMVITAVNQNPKLLACDPVSVIAAALQSAQLGLEPNTPLGQAYLIPYEERRKNETSGRWETARTVCNFQPGYRGLITLAFRSGELQCIDAQEVYANDLFEYEYGMDMHLRHVPAGFDRKRPDEKPVYYYAVYRLKNGGCGMQVMSYEDVLEHAKKFSKTYSSYKGTFSGPWKDNFNAMAKKTVLLKLMKYMPMATDTPLARAVAADGASFTGRMQEDSTQPEFVFDYSGAVEADYEEIPEEKPGEEAAK